MLTKKCKKSVRSLGTIVILIVYVTIDRYNSATVREERSKRNPRDPVPEQSTAADNLNSGTVKTIVGYSREFKVRKVLADQVVCRKGDEPVGDESSGDTSKWKFDRRLGMHLFSAHLDLREDPYRYIRIIGLAPRNVSVYCQLRYDGVENSTFVNQKAVVREIWSTSWGTGGKNCEETYPVLISCLVPPGTRSPAWVSFVDKDCRGNGAFLRVLTPSSTPVKNNFVICVKSLHFTSLNPKTFLEWTEINHRLGADKIVVYTSDPEQERAIPESRILDRKRFETPPEVNCFQRNFEDSTWHRRKLEIIAYNDCFYRYLNRTKFVIPLDVDEIIVPKTGNGWIDAFRVSFPTGSDAFAPDNFASFSVRNAYFFSDYPETAIFRGFKLPNLRDRNVPVKLVNSLARRKNGQSGGSGSGSPFSRTLRSYRLSPRSDSVKSFVQVSKTLSVFNHFTFHVLDDAVGRQYILPETTFQLNHYRNSCDPVLIEGCDEFLSQVTYDDSLEKFRTSGNGQVISHNETVRSQFLR